MATRSRSCSPMSAVGRSRQLDIHFRTNKLRDCAQDESAAVREFGPRVGRKFFEVINRLEGLTSIDEVRQMRDLDFHRLQGDRAGQHALKLGRRERLIVLVTDDESLEISEVSLQHYE